MKQPLWKRVLGWGPTVPLGDVLDLAGRVMAAQRNDVEFASPQTVEDLRFRGFDWSDGVRELDQDFARILMLVGCISDYTVCVGARAETLASVPFRVVQKADHKPVKNPPRALAKILDRPNPDQSFSDLVEGAVWQYDLTGEAHFLGVDRSGGYSLGAMSEELWILRSSLIRPVYDNDKIRPGRESREGDLIGWSFGDYATARWPAEAVAFAKRHNPRDSIRGLSPLKEMENEVRLHVASGKSTESYYANGAYPGTIITSEVEPPDSDAWREQFRRQHVGAKNWGKALWLWASGIKVERMRDAPKDAMQMEIRKATQQAFRSKLRVPPFILADVEHANWSNSVEQQLYFWRHSIMPLERSILGPLNRSRIVPDSQMVVADYSEIEALQPNRGEQATYLSTLVAAEIITRNEAREALGFPPIAGGDELGGSDAEVEELVALGRGASTGTAVRIPAGAEVEA